VKSFQRGKIMCRNGIVADPLQVCGKVETQTSLYSPARGGSGSGTRFLIAGMLIRYVKIA
jgi:hypothetical protein